VLAYRGWPVLGALPISASAPSRSSPWGGQRVDHGERGCGDACETMQMRRSVGPAGQWRRRESEVVMEVESDWTGHSSTGARTRR
jgi:hypothetical protein